MTWKASHERVGRRVQSYGILESIRVTERVCGTDTKIYLNTLRVQREGGIVFEVLPSLPRNQERRETT